MFFSIDNLRSSFITYWRSILGWDNFVERKIQDPVLGELIWNEKYHWWKAEARSDSDFPFAVYLMDYPVEAVEDLESYQSLFKILRQNEPAAREYAAQELLDVYNTHWSNNEFITKEEFCRRMIPESVILSKYDADESEYQYTGEDLFGEHTIVVSMTKSGVFTYACFEG